MIYRATFNRSLTLISLFLCSSFLMTPARADLYTEKLPQESRLNDGKLHIFLCGTGDPEVAMQEIGKPACLAIVNQGKLLLVDAGEGSIQTLASLGLPYQDLQHVFITHWHSDHFAGLAQVINASWYNGRHQPLNVYGPAGVNQVMAGLKQAYALDVKFRSANRKGMLDPVFAFGVPNEIDAVKKDAVVYNQQDLKITAFEVDHQPVFPALGFELQYKGCKIVISGDTRVAPSLAKHAKKADVLINEVLSNPLYVIKPGVPFANQVKNYHSDSLALAKMAQASDVKNLVLTHLVPAIPTTKEVVNQFIGGMNQYYTGPITVGADKDELVLESSGAGDCQFSFKPAAQPVKEAMMAR